MEKARKTEMALLDVMRQNAMALRVEADRINGQIEDAMLRILLSNEPDLVARLNAMEMFPPVEELTDDDLTIGDWPCEASPVEVCVYFADDGPMDFCLFCGEPHERK